MLIPTLGHVSSDPMAQRRWLLLWLLAIVATVVLSFPTLRLSSRLQYDEAFMVDSGRTEWPAGDKSHAFTWTAGNRPLRLLSFLGPLATEAAYRSAGNDLIGVRLFCLIGAVAAAAAAVWWLTSRGMSFASAACCSLLLLWDPLLTNSYRGGRPDAWAIGLMIAALAVIRFFPHAASPRWRPTLWHLMAGLLIALSGLTWISSVLLAPLVLYELWRRAESHEQHPALPFFLDSTAIAALASVFLAIGLFGYAGDVGQRLADYSLHAGMIPPGSQWNGAAFLRCMGRSLWPVLLCGPLLLVHGRLLLPALGVFGVAALAVLATGAYDHRMTYLLPYALAITSDGDAMPRRSWARRSLAVALCCSLAYAGGVSLVARTAVALRLPPGRAPAALTDAMRTAIGDDDIRLLLAAPQPYYSARDLGWHAFGLIGPFEDNELTQLIRSMDYVVTPQANAERRSAAEQHLANRLAEAGFEEWKTVSSGSIASIGLTGLGIPSGYGPFAIFRPGQQPPAASTRPAAEGSVIK